MVQAAPMRGKPSSNVFLHPAALLVAVVATAFFKHSEARAATATGEDGSREHLASPSANLGQTESAHGWSISLNAAQCAAILSAIVSLINSVAPTDADAAGSGLATDGVVSDQLAGDHCIPIDSTASQQAGAEPGADLSPATVVVVHDVAEAGPVSPAVLAKVLPLVAVLGDLALVPAATKGFVAGSDVAQSDASGSPSAGGPVWAVASSTLLTLTFVHADSGTGESPSLQSAKVSYATTNGVTQTHDVAHPDLLAANLVTALLGAEHTAVAGTVATTSSSFSFAQSLLASISSAAADNSGTFSFGQPLSDLPAELSNIVAGPSFAKLASAGAELVADTDGHAANGAFGNSQSGGVLESNQVSANASQVLSALPAASASAMGVNAANAASLNESNGTSVSLANAASLNDSNGTSVSAANAASVSAAISGSPHVELSSSDLQAIILDFMARISDYTVTSAGKEVVLYDVHALTTDLAHVKTISFDFSDGSSLSLIGLPATLPHLNVG